MRLVKDKLYLTFKEAVECGLASEQYLWKAKSERVRSWDFIQDPEDGRRVLIGYDRLSTERKRKVQDRYGENPYEHTAKEPILAMVETDVKAMQYYRSYTYDGGKYLPLEAVVKYTRAASWLKLLARPDLKKLVSDRVNLKLTEFYKHCGDLLVVERERGKLPGCTDEHMVPGDFPTSYQRLIDRVKRYQTDGIEGVVAPEWGNKKGAKLGNTEGGFALDVYDAQMAVIRTALGKHQNLDCETVAKMVNSVFEQKGLKTVSSTTIKRILKENEHMLMAGRQGKRAYENKVARQVSRKAPEYPGDYYTLDGWTVELAYRIPGPKGGGEFGRLVVVVVLDAHNKYIAGYAIGERETPELIRQANRNAILHMKELLGDYYRPWQLQSDRYSIKNLTEFYTAMTKLYTPAAVGNSKAKVIEPYFRHLNDHYCRMLPNWTGHNVDAKKENQVNREFADKIKHQFPDREGVIEQIKEMIKMERDYKRAEYLTKWAEKPAEDKLVMSEADMLEVFGEDMGRTVRITGKGLQKTIDKVTYLYDSFEPTFRANMHLDWTLMVNRDDMSKVLAKSPDGKLKMVLTETRVVPMEARRHTEEDHAYLSAIREFNNDRRQEVVHMYERDAELTQQLLSGVTLGEGDARTELALKMMFTVKGQQKEGIQDAKGLGSGARKSLQEGGPRKSLDQNSNEDNGHDAWVKQQFDSALFFGADEE